MNSEEALSHIGSVRKASGEDKIQVFKDEWVKQRGGQEKVSGEGKIKITLFFPKIKFLT